MLLPLCAALLAAPPSGPRLADALGAWHTRYAILGTSGTLDFFQVRRGCLLGVPREGGPTVYRCGEGPAPEPGDPPPDLEAVLERAAADQRYDAQAKRTSVDAWVGAWREVRVLELVPTPFGGGMAAEGVVARDGASGVYGWRRAAVPSVEALTWIDWQPPADLDGTSIVLSAGSDSRYVEPKAALEEAAIATVARYVAGDALPMGLAEVPGGPLYSLPQTRFAVETVVFTQSDLAERLGLPWDFRDIDLPVALLDDPIRYETRLPGSRANLLLTLSRFGATLEIAAPGRPCEAEDRRRGCRIPRGTVAQVTGSVTLPLRREGAAAALDKSPESRLDASDGALGAPRGVRRRQWIIGVQLDASRHTWRGEHPILVVGPSTSAAAEPVGTCGSHCSDWRPPGQRPPREHLETFAAPASAAMGGADGRWRVRGRRSAFPLRLPVAAGQAVTLEVVAFAGDTPPFPHDPVQPGSAQGHPGSAEDFARASGGATGPVQRADARQVQAWTWTFMGPRPRWVRVQWKAGDRLLATAILPV